MWFLYHLPHDVIRWFSLNVRVHSYDSALNPCLRHTIVLSNPLGLEHNIIPHSNGILYFHKCYNSISICNSWMAFTLPYSCHYTSNNDIDSRHCIVLQIQKGNQIFVTSMATKQIFRHRGKSTPAWERILALDVN